MHRKEWLAGCMRPDAQMCTAYKEGVHRQERPHVFLVHGDRLTGLARRVQVFGAAASPAELAGVD